jgi:hypothetical protein
VLSNITFWGDLKRTLASNQRQNFIELREKRNATEILHAYIGKGLEIMQDKGGPYDYRCDFIDTPSVNQGICEVNAGTPAGFYNFTYTTDAVPSTAEEDGPTAGYGSNTNNWWAATNNMRPRSLLTGEIFSLTIYPTLFSVDSAYKRVGRLGGANVTVKCNAAGIEKGNFSTRYLILLEGVPCIGAAASKLGHEAYITCVTGPLSSRIGLWPTLADQLPAGYWPTKWREGEGIGYVLQRRFFPASQKRDFQIIEDTYPSSGCSGSGTAESLGDSVYTLEECANACFAGGSCRWFDYDITKGWCYWC